MRENRPSKTAYKVSLNIVTLGAKPGMDKILPPGIVMGIGAKLLEGLTERVGDIKLFSIISSDNAAAQKMALKNQTRRVATFYSKKLGKEVGVWMPVWMIED